MLKDWGEPVPMLQCLVKYAPRAANCKGPYPLGRSISGGLSVRRQLSLGTQLAVKYQTCLI